MIYMILCRNGKKDNGTEYLPERDPTNGHLLSNRSDFTGSRETQVFH